MRNSVAARAILLGGAAAAGLFAVPSLAQDAPPPPAAEENSDNREILVTGSRIKQDPTRSALPLQVIGTQELEREGISSPEQLISYLSTNGNGADNLASNADVTSGAQRGTNGLSAANLRGQGPGGTLILLNGRRVAAHGLTGSAVDVNQIPFAALERVEVLKDGASAIYGTDAVGGVINFITKTDFQGMNLNAFSDITDEGDSPIYSFSGTFGYGDLQEQGFNVMAAVAYRKNGGLAGSARDFVNGNQPERGLSIDTRGTPVATIFPNGTNALFAPTGSLISGLPAAALTAPGSTVQANGGINPLDLPGGAGCTSFDGGMPYDEALWAAPANRFACAWDTGRAAVLQQPLETVTYYGRATLALGDHQLYGEVTGSIADSLKRFSNNQYAGNTTTLPLYYPRNALTAATYDQVYNQLRATFPGIAVNFGKPIAYRWRCMICGPREYVTNTETFRVAAGLTGPIAAGWDYDVGASFAKSESNSVLGRGYHFRGIFSSAARAAASGIPGAVSGGIDPRAPTAPGATAPGIVGLLNSGIINIFSVNQSPQAIAALDAISAEGEVLYGGKYEVKQFDASVSGALFDLPGGEVSLALGVDYRKETYAFNGSAAAELNRAEIFNVAFDNANALTPKSREIKSAYAELLVPLFDMLELSGAVRIDDYSGFGSTVNPKFTARFMPFDWLAFRGSYNTGFRAPAFNQVFNGQSVSPNPGNNLVDPTTCSLAAPNPAVPGCAAITPESVSGGNPNLGPETSEQYSFGIVLRPAPRFSASVDFWSVAVDDVIGSLTIRQLLDNAAFFPERLIRNAAGTIVLLDLTTANIGSRRTQGIEVSLRGGFDALGGQISMGLDGTRLVKKKEKFLPAAPYGPSQIGVFSFAGDLGLKWKHSAFISWSDDKVDLSFSQIYRDGYQNQALPGIASGAVTRPGFNPRVKPYIIYNLNAGLRINEQFRITAGVKNLFDTDPPFAITYDSNTGAGSSWEPRVADPRGRSFTVSIDSKF
jgi:iron complex outermembrane receptor protein